MGKLNKVACNLFVIIVTNLQKMHKSIDKMSINNSRLSNKQRFCLTR